MSIETKWLIKLLDAYINEAGVDLPASFSYEKLYEAAREHSVIPIIFQELYVSAKYSCGFPDPQVLPIIVVERYLDYFTTIMEDRLWQVLAKPVFQWRNRSGLSMNAARAA